jgi:LmbE family N-acetylglucosaminyl deacetylase
LPTPSNNGAAAALAALPSVPDPPSTSLPMTSTELLIPPTTLVERMTTVDITASQNATERQVTRIAAIESEIRWIYDASRSWPKRSMLAWRRWTLSHQAPFALIRRKAGRFRLPRQLKRELMNRFCSGDEAALKSLTTVIIAAHPDDESIGAGARLVHLGDAYVVAVTDGAPRDETIAQRHGFPNREAYAAARREELKRALVIADVPENRFISFDFIDGDASHRLAELALRITDLLDTIRPQVVVTHPYEGGHTDHDATAFAVHLACGVLSREGITPPAILELTSYHARNGKKVVQEFLPHPGADRDQRLVELTADDRDSKERIFACFASQRHLLEQFSIEFEKFRPAPRYVFTKPPHDGQLNYERYGDPDRGKAWREQAERALRILRMRRD